MKPLTLILILTIFHSFGQSVKQFETKIEMNFDFGMEVKNDWKRRDQLIKDLESGKRSWNDITDKESQLFEKYDETYQSMWDIEGGGCSWYCGAGEYSVTTSSELSSNGKINYKSGNLKDFSYQTAWVEGVKGHGIGETIEFKFVPQHPRITTIKIANGYIKSKKSWKNNSRVKKLKMYVNDSIYGIINLKDIYSLQSIELKTPIGYSDRKNFDRLKKLPKWKIKFEILEVYKGDKYTDTVISEIFFDGIDVH